MRIASQVDSTSRSKSRYAQNGIVVEWSDEGDIYCANERSGALVKRDDALTAMRQLIQLASKKWPLQIKRAHRRKLGLIKTKNNECVSQHKLA